MRCEHIAFIFRLQSPCSKSLSCTTWDFPELSQLLWFCSEKVLFPINLPEQASTLLLLPKWDLSLCFCR